MTADSLFTLDPATTGVTVSDSAGGGAGRGGSPDGSQGPLVVVQQPRNTAPPRPAPQRTQGNTGNSLRNGYAAISHSVSGETAAIGIGFLLGGPIGAVIGGAALPAAAAAAMWRARRREHDQNTNQGDRNNPSSSGSGTRTSGPGGGGRNQGGGRSNTNGSGPRSSADRNRHRTPNTPKTGNGNGGTGGSGTNRKPKIKDPVADKLNKLGKGLADKLKNRDKTDKAPKNKKTDTGKNTGPSAGGKGSTGPKSPKQPKTNKDRGWLKNRGPQPDSPKPWAGRDTKPKKHRKDKNATGDGPTSSTARDGLTPKLPKSPKHPSGGGTGHSAGADDVIDAELIDDDLPPKPSSPPADIIDGEVIDEDRITLVRTKREKKKRRAVQAAAKKAGEQAARTGTQGDPAHVIRQGNHHIDVQIHHENHLIALSKAAEQTRSTPVDYPAIQAAPTGTRTAGVAIARQIDVRGTTAYAILRAMADQLAHGLHSDDDADMGDHIIELTGIPNMCKNLSVAVQEAGQALAKTAPLHPTVIKHLNNAAVAARTAGVMAENIMVVFVQAHREDIIRILDPRLGEERWNIRNAPGTLDAAKLRAAIASAHSTRLALPGGGNTGGGQGGSKLVPASDGSTRKLIDLMKNFKRGHMVNVLSEVAGSAAGVDAVSVSITKLYKRMQTTWPTENVVDETVARTAGQVRRVSVELHKAIGAARKIHDRELRLNSTGRAGKGAYAERKWDVAGRPAASN
ncbi:hypothetical protein ABZ329_29560 [Streptomyces rubiginosohelvolus]|uniref:hypothetical protein n=1 Tax=Streptomyces rubiginosohelvolus TaxID=67362 RepID=UPI0033D70BFD